MPYINSLRDRAFLKSLKSQGSVKFVLNETAFIWNAEERILFRAHLFFSAKSLPLLKQF